MRVDKHASAAVLGTLRPSVTLEDADKSVSTLINEIFIAYQKKSEHKDKIRFVFYNPFTYIPAATTYFRNPRLSATKRIDAGKVEEALQYINDLHIILNKEAVSPAVISYRQAYILQRYLDVLSETHQRVLKLDRSYWIPTRKGGWISGDYLEAIQASGVLVTEKLDVITTEIAGFEIECAAHREPLDENLLSMHTEIKGFFDAFEKKSLAKDKPATEWTSTLKQYNRNPELAKQKREHAKALRFELDEVFDSFARTNKEEMIGQAAVYKESWYLIQLRNQLANAIKEVEAMDRDAGWLPQNKGGWIRGDYLEALHGSLALVVARTRDIDIQLTVDPSKKGKMHCP